MNVDSRTIHGHETHSRLTAKQQQLPRDKGLIDQVLFFIDQQSMKSARAGRAECLRCRQYPCQSAYAASLVQGEVFAAALFADAVPCDLVISGT